MYLVGLHTIQVYVWDWWCAELGLRLMAHDPFEPGMGLSQAWPGPAYCVVDLQ
jgi:hypothetical protein